MASFMSSLVVGAIPEQLSGMVGEFFFQKEKENFSHSHGITSQIQTSSMEDGSSAQAVPIDTVCFSESLQPLTEDWSVVDSVVQRKMGWEDAVNKFEEKVQDGYREHWEECIVLPEDGRFAGAPLPFRMATDDYVCLTLLLSFALSAFFIARSQHYLWVKAKEFLRSRSRENMFNDSSDERMMGKYFFAFVLCLSLSILLFDYQQIHYSASLREFSPYLLLGINLAGLGFAYVVRTMMYVFVNTIFFDREKNALWLESYHLLTVASNLLFFPLALLVVFYELDFSNWKILFSFSVVFVEIFLIFKTYRIFFEGFWGVLHLILYLCTLEILPLLTLWKGTVWVVQELTKLV